jgi:hypothetical protein
MGHKINVFDPKPEEIDIYDIAHALACNSRFNGHLKHFVSVAEHSIACSRYCRPEHALAALLHDGAEAYLSDVPRPIKAFLPEYNKIDAKLSQVILDKFDIEKIPQEVKILDRQMCLAEADDSGHDTKSWGEDHSIYGHIDYKPKYWTPEVAEKKFLERYFELRKLNVK